MLIIQETAETKLSNNLSIIVHLNHVYNAISLCLISFDHFSFESYYVYES